MPSTSPRGAAVLWLALAVLILLSIPLITLLASLRADAARLHAAVAEIQASGATLPAAGDLASMQAGTAQSMAAEASIEHALAGGIPWRAVLERVAPLPSSAIQITSLRQQGPDLTVEGVALDDRALRAYLGRIQGTPVFEATSLQASTNSTAGGAVTFTISIRLRGYTP